MAGIIGLVSWTISNSDRVLRLLKGLLDRLPAIGGAMESAGGQRRRRAGEDGRRTAQQR